MKRPLPGRAPLEVPGPLPARPFVVGERDGQRVPAPGGVVVDQGPVPGGQPDGLDPGAGIGERGVDHRRPRLAVVGRRAQANAAVRAVVAHEGHERAVVLPHQAGLDVAEADHRAARRPGLPLVVAEGHDRRRRTCRSRAAGSTGRVFAEIGGQAIG